MMNPPVTNDRALRESAVIEIFLESPNEESFADLFGAFTPQLVAFFRSRGCPLALSEDLTQEVMLTVYRKAAQVRDRSLFRAWLFKIARNALCRQYGKQSREVETVDLANVVGVWSRRATNRQELADSSFTLGWLSWNQASARL